MAGSLFDPVGLAEVPDPPEHIVRRVIFVEQRTARVGLIVGESVFTVGTVPGVWSADYERGLLGVAIDPGFPLRPYVYVHATDFRAGHHVVVSRFTLKGDLAFTGRGQLSFNHSSRYDLLTTLPDETPYHNGGTLRFGPHERLYVSLGDDFSGCPALEISQLVGKILRLDVSRLPGSAGGPPPLEQITPDDNPFLPDRSPQARLVWTFGLRNPFRFQIDPLDGALFIADVGENAWEELDLAATGGQNMGWPVWEGPALGTRCGDITPAAPPTPPIMCYDHFSGIASIAGPIYRRAARGLATFPAEYEGHCFLLDYYTGMLLRLKGRGAKWEIARPVAGQPSGPHWGEGFYNVSDMIELSDGSIWYCRQAVDEEGSGEVRRIVPQGTLGVPVRADSGVRLALPAPNPSTGRVAIHWAQPRRDRAELAVFDLNGRRVRTLQSLEVLDAGARTSEWDGLTQAGTPAEPGLYFARLRVGDELRQRRITRVR